VQENNHKQDAEQHTINFLSINYKCYIFVSECGNSD